MPGSLPRTEKIRTAVITGHHPFDVPGFHQALRSMPGIDGYPQALEDFVADAGGVREDYDALVFYNFHQTIPGEGVDASNVHTRKVLESLAESSQGIVVLHHGLPAFRQWPYWSDLCGISDRRVTPHMEQTVRVEIAEPGHPITHGLQPWEMVDETYEMMDAGEGSTVLLTTDHPCSMRTLGWTRQHGNARVFCFQSGHDNRVFSHPKFRTVLSRGIAWVAGRI